MSVPCVLLLTGTVPGSIGVGGIFLRELCLSYPKDNICCFAVTLSNQSLISPDLDWLPIAYGRRPRDRGFQQLGRYSARLTSFPVQQYVKMTQLPALITQAVEFGRKHNVEMVWAVLNSPILINMARKVASSLGAELVTSIFDPPERLALDLRFDGLSRHILLQEFERVLRASVRCGVASEGMQDEYRERYGIKSVVLILGAHPNLRRPPAKEPNSDKQFIIGFAGSMYAGQPWQALLSALSSINWRIDGRDVIVRFMGPGIHAQAEGRAHIEYLGWRSHEETVRLMSQVDVAYLPYWFDEPHSLAVRLCFPGKLPTYLAAGRPVLFHGPQDSSPARFFHRFPVGICCHSLEESEIISSLRRFATDREFYALATQAGQTALDEELGLHVLRRHFAALIGIEESQLLPLA